MNVKRCYSPKVTMLYCIIRKHTHCTLVIFGLIAHLVPCSLALAAESFCHLLCVLVMSLHLILFPLNQMTCHTLQLPLFLTGINDFIFL